MGDFVLLHDLKIEFKDNWMPHSENDRNDEEQNGKALASLLSGPEGLLMQVAYVKLAEGSENVLATKKISGPERFQNIVIRHRMGVRTIRDHKYAEVSITALKQDKPAKKEQCDLGEWNKVCNLDVEEVLKVNGALQIGTREAIEGCDSRRKNYLSVKFELDDYRTPVIVWALSKAVPVYLQYGLGV